MKDKTFFAVLLSITILGSVLTLAHLGWGVYAYQHASIIHFIAEEIW